MQKYCDNWEQNNAPLRLQTTKVKIMPKINWMCGRCVWHEDTEKHEDAENEEKGWKIPRSFFVVCFVFLLYTPFTSKSTIFARRRANRSALVPGCLCSIHYARAHARIMRADACAHTYNKFVIHQPATTWTPIDALQLHNAGIAAAATAVACTLEAVRTSRHRVGPWVRWTHKKYEWGPSVKELWIEMNRGPPVSRISRKE
jgi:hypothetical protein